jgi:hypothetical protein
MSEPQLYRRPPDPGGYIGGYNWGPALAGVGLLAICNILATQFVAHRLGYPGEAHSFTKPENLCDVILRVAAWFDCYLK